MCGRYIIVSKLEKIEKRFNVKSTSHELFHQNFNISPGDIVPVITSEQPDKLSFYRFGLQPFWAKKSMYLINARSEGEFNVENDPKYKGKLGIVDKPSFRKPIRSKRCLVPADAFIEGTTKEKLNKPFLVYPVNRDYRPFSMAGIYDEWVNRETGEIISSFAIITRTANNLLRKIPHHRSPVILSHRDEELVWLDTKAPLAEAENILRVETTEQFNAYPISPAIKNPRLKGIELIEPTGERILKEYDYVMHNDIDLVGMGMSPARKRKLNE